MPIPLRQHIEVLSKSPAPAHASSTRNQRTPDSTTSFARRTELAGQSVAPYAQRLRRVLSMPFMRLQRSLQQRPVERFASARMDVGLAAGQRGGCPVTQRIGPFAAGRTGVLVAKSNAEAATWSTRILSERQGASS